MPSSKKFFRLRRKGVKQRKTGYYWVHWSYGYYNILRIESQWRIAFYSSDLDSWALPCDLRKFKDDDFIAINEHQVRGPFGKGAKVIYWTVLLILIWNLGYIVHQIIDYIYKLPK